MRNMNKWVLGMGLCLALALVGTLATASSSRIKEGSAAALKDTALKPYPFERCLATSDEGLGDKPYVTAYQGQELKFCCKSCYKTFKKEPAKYMAYIAAGKLPGAAAAPEGSGKKACRPDCAKPCCAEKEGSGKKACGADCTKPCCAKPEGSGKKACGADCTKPCCAKKEGSAKKACCGKCSGDQKPEGSTMREGS